MYKVITLTCNRFASYSDEDGTVKLYSSEIYEQIEIPFEQQIAPNSLIQLKRQREVLVISSLSGYGHLHFYQLCYPYKLLGAVNKVCTTFSNGLTELSNGHVVASCYMPNYIYIVDPQTYELIAIIVDEEYIPMYGPLHTFGNDSYIYVPVTGGCLCEITMINGEYKIFFKTKESDNDLYGICICMVNNGKYLISSNRYNGCSIFKFGY